MKTTKLMLIFKIYLKFIKMLLSATVLLSETRNLQLNLLRIMENFIFINNIIRYLVLNVEQYNN